MPLTLDQLRDEALSLPVEERRHLMDSLWDSFDDTEKEDHPGEGDFSPAFLAELDRRSAEVADGTAILIPYEDVKRHMADLLRRT